MIELNRAVESIERGGAWHETDEVVQIKVRKPMGRVIPVRISGDKWEKFRRQAKELGNWPGYAGSYMDIGAAVPLDKGLD